MRPQHLKTIKAVTARSNVRQRMLQYVFQQVHFQVQNEMDTWTYHRIVHGVKMQVWRRLET